MHAVTLPEGTLEAVKANSKHVLSLHNGQPALHMSRRACLGLSFLSRSARALSLNLVLSTLSLCRAHTHTHTPTRTHTHSNPPNPELTGNDSSPSFQSLSAYLDSVVQATRNGNGMDSTPGPAAAAPAASGSSPASSSSRVRKPLAVSPKPERQTEGRRFSLLSVTSVSGGMAPEPSWNRKEYTWGNTLKFNSPAQGNQQLSYSVNTPDIWGDDDNYKTYVSFDQYCSMEPGDTGFQFLSSASCISSTEGTCTKNFILQTNTQACLFVVCDNTVSDCTGTVEATFTGGELLPQCTSSEFTCGDGACISADYKCDAYDDCSDASDESVCSGRLSVSSPRSSTTWVAGTEATVTWSSRWSSDLSVKIELWDDDVVFDDLYKTIASKEANTGSYTFTVPGSWEPSTNDYYVRVSVLDYNGNAAVETDDTPIFVLKESTATVQIQKPLPAQQVIKGSQIEIVWTSSTSANDEMSITLWQDKL